jgi:hypothetical protein
LFESLLLTLLSGVEVVETSLKTPDLVFERSEVPFSLAVLLNL